MTWIYCRQNHPNGPENRFCAVCGELLLQSPAAGQLQVLAGRYRIRRELGQGGFGRTYLAEDIHRFNEYCVLKEFAPQVQGDEALKKAEALFEREAGVLYQLQHPQIPRFRELFRAAFAAPDTLATPATFATPDNRSSNQPRLFLVQDYVEGSTYCQILEARIASPAARPPYFSEAEIRLLLAQILPVLRYIHGAGVIHRDLSPDNLVLRSRDQMPVLIDFGGVKQLAATATSNYTQTAHTQTAETQVPTHLGKGYAPPEQMQQGQVSPQSDLYALAVIIWVLLTGSREVAALDGQSYPWQQVPLSPELTALLTRMLSPQPASRFPSAEAVLLTLEQLPMQTASTQPASTQPALTQPTSTQATSTQTIPVSPAWVPSALAQTETPLLAPARGRFVWLLWLPLLVLPAVAYFGRDRWLPLLPSLSTAPDSAPSASNPSASNPSASNPADSSPISMPMSALERRAQAADIDYGFLIKLTDTSFAQRYPKQAGRKLSDSPDDAQWRQKWADLADDWLENLPQAVSSESRQTLGRYGEADRGQWKQRLNQRYVGSRSLYDLTDAQFLQHFPDWRESLRDKDFLSQPIGQVWQAIAADQTQAIETGQRLDQIEFAAGAFSQQTEGTLAAGEGRVYTANLAAGQVLRLNLQAPAKGSLSLYLPRPTPELPVLLEDSTETTWAGKLPQSGYYEVVVVNSASQPIRYQLTLAVDNVTSTPAKPEQPAAPEAKN